MTRTDQETLAAQAVRLLDTLSFLADAEQHHAAAFTGTAWERTDYAHDCRLSALRFRHARHRAAARLERRIQCPDE